MAITGGLTHSNDMNDASPTGSAALPALAPLPYHQDVVRYLQDEEPEVWRWACSASAQDEHAKLVRAELLRQTYRLDEEAHPALHASARVAAKRLGLEVPLHLYQATDGPMNAALYFLPGEAHVVFSGPLLERLQGAELEAVLGHELAHYLLWSSDEGRYHAADRVLNATCDDPRAMPAHLETARLYRLFTEAFADRGGVVACGALEPAVAALVKTRTGLHAVSASSYLKQADEIAGSGALDTGASHPEIFVRARALRLWSEADAQADRWLSDTLRGPLRLEGVDLIGQQALAVLTRRVLRAMLRPAWMRGESTLAHARHFFPDFDLATGPDADPDEALAADVAAAAGCHDYVAALLLDLATADRALEDAPLAAALELARAWGLAAVFESRLSKDLAMTKRQLNKLAKDAAEILRQAEASHA